MSEYFIAAKGVKRCFRVSGEDFYALKGVDVMIPEGKLTILKGRSGSGKTTLLNIISALDKPTEGTVEFGGRELTRLGEGKRAKIRRKEIGYVFQSVALIPIMNAVENVEYALRMARAKGNHHERAMECLKMVGLGGRALHMPQEMSGGEQQRVAIARAMAHHPKVIFAVEPTGELDTNTALQVVKIFKELCEKEHVTIVMTTHDTGLMEVGDAVYELQDGEVVHGDA